MKRLFDIVFSIMFIFFALPIYLFLTLFLVLESGFPVFFIQKRVGLKGKLFSIYKFRTMVKNANEIGPYNTAKDDPRITKTGRFFRKTSLDELPQFFNVLKGDMSIVGPRPNVERQKAEYQISDWELRNSVRPGITGLAQISGRSSCTFEERLYYDITYIKSYSLLLDFKIIYRTVMSVVLKQGSF